MSFRRTRTAIPSTRISLASVFILIPYQREHAIDLLIDGLLIILTIRRRWIGDWLWTTARVAFFNRTRLLECCPDCITHSLDLEGVTPPVILTARPHCLIDGLSQRFVPPQVVVKCAFSWRVHGLRVRAASLWVSHLLGEGNDPA